MAFGAQYFAYGPFRRSPLQDIKSVARSSQSNSQLHSFCFKAYLYQSESYFVSNYPVLNVYSAFLICSLSFYVCSFRLSGNVYLLFNRSQQMRICLIICYLHNLLLQLMVCVYSLFTSCCHTNTPINGDKPSNSFTHTPQRKLTSNLSYNYCYLQLLIATCS